MAARRGRNQNKRARFVVTGALCIAMLSPLVLVSAAGATTGTTYSFTLDGSSTFVAGNTKVVSTGSTATGTATVIVSGSGSNQTLTISGTYSGLEGTATSVVIGSPQNSTTGTLLAFAGGITTTGGSSGTFGPQTAFSSLGSELAAGELTIGLESTAFPNGEIGGSNPAAPQLPPDASKTYFVGSSSANYVITTTGNPAPTLALTGALPSGVTFSTSAGNVNTTSGFFSGRPAAGTAGSYPVTLTASNGLSPDAVQHITLVVEDTPSITSTSGTSFFVGSSGSFTVKTANDPNPSISESGALPAGVRFVDNRDGTATLSGSPGTGTVGSYPITITAADDLATEATQSFTLTVAKADQSVAFVGAPSTAVYGGQYFPETSLGPGTAVSISVDPSSAPGSCADDPRSVSFTGLGTCVLDADRAANADWNAAPEAQVSIVVGPASQSVSFTSEPTSTSVGNSYTPSVSGGGSGNPLGISLDPASSPGTCSLGGGTVTFAAPGTCLLDANESGDVDYLPAAQAQQRITVTATNPGPPIDVSASGGNTSATISWSPPTSDGGSAVTGYVVAATSGFKSCTAPSGATSCTIGGLLNDWSYSFTVSAVNALGTGSVARSNAVTPTAPPAVTPPVKNAPPPLSVPGTDFGPPVSLTTSGGTRIVIDSHDAESAFVTVPAGALPSGSTISVYPVVNPGDFAKGLPSGQSYLASFAVTFVGPDGSSTTAASPITMTLRDPAIVARDVVYEITPGGLKAVGSATVTGTVTVQFTDDPTFVVAAVPRLSVRSTHLTRSGARLPIVLTCTASSCRGSATLLEPISWKVKRGKTTLTMKRTVVLGRVAYDIASGQHRRMNLKLNSTGQKLLRNHPGGLREVLSMSTVGAVSVSRTVTIR